MTNRGRATSSCEETSTRSTGSSTSASWSDGLPIVPPTLTRVETFLEHTARDPDEELGVLLPDKRRATVWNVAVNGRHGRLPA